MDGVADGAANGVVASVAVAVRASKMPHPTGMRDVLHRGRRGLERAKKGLEKAKWKSPLAMDPGSVEARLDRNKSLQEIRYSVAGCILGFSSCSSCSPLTISSDSRRI